MHSNYVCRNCGWSSGPTNKDFSTCPNCSKFTHRTDIYESEAERKAAEEERVKEMKFAIFVIAVVLAYVVIFFPGSLLLMLLHQFVEIESGFWNWVLAIILSLALFLIMRCNITKYLIADGVIVLIATIIGWCVEDFHPWLCALDALTILTPFD